MLIRSILEDFQCNPLTLHYDGRHYVGRMERLVGEAINGFLRTFKVNKK